MQGRVFAMAKTIFAVTVEKWMQSGNMVRVRVRVRG